MTETKLYIVRHGKTMFNTIGRAQGWSDSPLTEQGEQGIHELGIGLREAAIPFVQAYSSDSGRTIQTMTILLEELGLAGKIPYHFEKRIREWGFGSFDGAYGGDLFHGVIPRVLDVEDYKTLTLEEFAEGIYAVDTAGWAEPWSQLSQRILAGFTEIAQNVEANGGGNALVVSHSLTIWTIASLIDPSIVLNPSVKNASVTVVRYKDHQFQLETVGDTSYQERGHEILRGNSSSH
ncbi:histidine phosphatase family protein [Streptococcus sp. DD13]|uniref:histidine phosphatase family protein n=1 Tax=Streptococcus sp. DD13 TaxID=1777881 RepID=UPI000799E452|nr:histidine phosphatase family protein [Streptococcus sp. DD13]KXT78023.1 Phosphoglycerate mutase family [Streptococcus sp. DD13]